MKEISQNEANQIILDILLHIASLCEEHNLRYFIDCGTLIGAIRHKGFIPWDDDIDIGMPREDYEILAREYKNWEHPAYYKLFHYNTDPEYSFPFMKLGDTRTSLQMTRNVGEVGLNIDIFPFDGIPGGKVHGYIHSWFSLYLQKAQSLANRSTWHVKKYTLRERIARIVFRCLTLGASVRFFCRLQEKLNRRHRMRDCTWSANLTWRFNFSRGLARDFTQSEAFLSTVDVEFEGHQLKAPIGYDAYLTQTYGDYMTPPPLEKRTNIHNFGAWWKDGYEPKD